MSIQQILEEAINLFGLNDARTIELSQLRDEEILPLQRKRYEKWIINQRGVSYGEKQKFMDSLYIR